VPTTPGLGAFAFAPLRHFPIPSGLWRTITAGLKVFIFLSSSGVDLVRKRAADTTQVNPLEPLAKLINDFMARGGTIWACTPCVKSRGYSEADLLNGVVITGASVMHDRIKAGAATLSF
jgi:predicted peroxiredoxin